MVSPVTYRPASDTRNSTAFETSAGSTSSVGNALTRRAAVFGCAAIHLGKKSLTTIGVSTPQGCIEFTRMLYSPSAPAYAFMSPTTPNLGAKEPSAPPDLSGVCAPRPAAELVMTIEPPRLPDIRWETVACRVFHTPVN